jgi:hypothetical protein
MLRSIPHTLSSADSEARAMTLSVATSIGTVHGREVRGGCATHAEIGDARGIRSEPVMATGARTTAPRRPMEVV